ncbi:MAG: hypothetical protein ACE5KQ_03085 [Thermoplasmata archaeon]
MLRFYHVLFVLAGVLFFGGFALVDNGLDLRTSFQGEESFAIPAGAQWYYAVELPMQAGSRIHIDFQETSKRAITVLLLPEGDFQAFLDAEGIPVVLGATTASSGALAVNLRDAGTYFLVFTHASETRGVLQEVHLRYSFSGVQPPEPDWLLIALGVVTAGFGAVVVAMAAMRRIRAYRRNEPEAAA